MANMSKILAFVTVNLLICAVYGQNLTLDGYVFESGNRGYLNVAQIDVFDDKEQLLGTTFSDLDGHFVIDVPARFNYKVVATKDMFDAVETLVDVEQQGDSNKIFLQLKMDRSPGYIFEITLAEKRDHDSIIVDAIKNSRIEVYNNTTKEPVMVLEDHPHPQFNVALIKGNHYTILVRKDGFLAKRMEAFVNIEGCILCFEGVGSVTPGVSDNLTGGNDTGVLLANVELDRIYEGKTIPINNILYEFGSSELDKRDMEGLESLATLMSDNPDLTVEIGSHTDSRGGNERNMELSRERAQKVVDFLVDNEVLRSRLISRGYGETELKNDCTNGVDCSDREHRQNRRTELKVLGIASVKAEIKTLAHIKQLEQGEALLEEIQFGGQIQIPLDSTAIESDSLHLDEVIKQSQSEAIGNTSVDADESIETEIEEEESMSSIIYRIVIKESEEILSEEDSLYTLHSNLIEYKNEDGNYLYMIGEYDTLRAIERFFKTVRIAYPDAYKIQDEEGTLSRI